MPLSLDSTLSQVLAAIGALSIALFLVAIIAWRRTEYTLGQAFLYLVNALFNKLLWRTKVSGPLPARTGEGAVIVCNHRSGIDPLLIQMASPRVVHWMVAKEYVAHPAMAWAFKILRSIPVNRGGVDTASTKLAIRLAQNGGIVGLFPEGRINTSENLLLPGRPGAALIALKARVPVIPCYVEGSPYNGTALGSFLMRAHAKVNIGEPIDLSAYYDRPDSKEAQLELTKRFLLEIAKLAGHPEFAPKLAGKRWKPDEDADGNDLTADEEQSDSPAADAAIKEPQA